MHPDKMTQNQIDVEVDVSKKMLEKGYVYIIFPESYDYKIPLYSKTIQGVCDICRKELKEEKPYIIHVHSFLAKYEGYETSERIK